MSLVQLWYTYFFFLCFVLFLCTGTQNFKVAKSYTLSVPSLLCSRFLYGLPLHSFSHYRRENEKAITWEWALHRYIRFPFTADLWPPAETNTKRISFWLERNASQTEISGGKWEVTWCDNYLSVGGFKKNVTAEQLADVEMVWMTLQKSILNVNAVHHVHVVVKHLLLSLLRWSAVSTGLMTLRSTETSRWRW